MYRRIPQKFTEKINPGVKNKVAVKMPVSHTWAQALTLPPDSHFLLTQMLEDNVDGSSDWVPNTHVGP